MSTPKVKFNIAVVIFFLISASALADENQSAKPNTNSEPKATHIKAKVLDGGNEVDGGNARTPSTTEGLPYTDEEVKSSDPISRSNKNMPVDQD